MNINVNSHCQEKNINPMGPPCNSQFCRKSKFRQCNDICETMQVELFDHFWLELKSWEVRKQYVSTLVDKIPIKQYECTVK